MTATPVMTFDQIADVLDSRTLEILEHRQGTRRLQRRGWLVRRALLAADLIALTSAFVLSEEIFGVSHGVNGRVAPIGEYVLFALSLPVWVVAAKLYGLYDRDEERTDHSTADDFTGVFHLLTVVTWMLVALAHITPFAEPRFGKLLLFWALAVTLLPLARALGRSYCRNQIQYLQNTVIVGAGDVGQSLAKRILKHPEYGLNLVGFVDGEPREQQSGLEHVALLGNATDLPHLVELLDIERVVFAFSLDSQEEMVDLARTLNELDVQVDVVPRLFEILGPGVDLHSIEGMPVMGLRPFRLSRSSALIKRSVDTAGAALGLTALAPLFLVVALLIKLDSTGPVFFRQVRAGRRGQPFRIWKFRTMSADAEDRKDDIRHLNVHLHPGGDTRMFKIADDPRTTRVGAVLRKYSIDELPQLINVLCGEMSLVGPRPLILEEAEFVQDWGRRRLNLKPGMTGLWQVLGRSDIPFAEMVRLDYVYVTGWSLWSDVRLLGRTLPAVFRPRGRTT